MSYLNNYRINFWGGISTNPCTANNDDVNDYYVDPVKAMLSPCLISKTDEDAVKVLESNPGWNYFGDYVTKFSNAKISSFGEPNAPETAGGIIGQGVYMLGSLNPINTTPNPKGSPILVDMDSTGTSCTQILVGGLQIGGTNSPILRINEDTRCYTRSLQTVDADGDGAFQMKSVNIDPPGFGMANTSWQLSFKYSADWVYDADNAQISALVEKAKAAKGITMVFTQFEVMTIFSREAILQEYADKKGTMNPVLGYTIGSIGIWEEDESDTCLPGRLLKGLSTMGDPSMLSLCDTYAQLDETTKILSLNMASTFIKPAPRAKREDLSSMSPSVDPGPIAIAVDVAGTAEIVASIPYDPTNYYLYGGMVDILLTADQITKIKSGDLLIVQTETNGTIIKNNVSKEQTYRFISDNRGEYIDPNSTNELEFNITKWGQPVTEDLTLDIVFSDSGQLSAQFDQYTEMNVGFSTSDGTKIPFSVLNAANHSYTGSTTVKASDAAAFKLNAEWVQAGLKQVSLIVRGASNANYYMVMRTYCDDDYSGIPDDQKFTWDFVYKEVLRYYYIVFPAMSTHLPLNNEKLISKQVYGAVLERVSDEYKNTTLLMPMTRDMSPGKTKLLTDYLNYINPKEPG
jgi:hypothetical protein